MIRKYAVPIVALLFIGLAIYHVARSAQSPPPAPPPREPVRTPFARTVAGAGIVEAETENIAIGSELPGVVAEVFVRVGDKVRPGDRLFRLDDRHVRADLAFREAALKAAEAQLALLEQQPRPEEVPVTEAKVREAQAALAEQRDLLRRARELLPRRAISEEEVVRREQAFRVAQEQLARAEAELRLLKAGAWEPQKAVARAGVAQAQAQLDQTRTELERLTVRARVDGEILQANVHPGEFVGTPPERALIILGKVRRLHVRVDIDEHDIPRFRPGAPAQAMLRGLPQEPLPLRFVRVEPYVVPKKSLTGDNTERVDTRVLQVIYAFEPAVNNVYVGQQLDVFIQADPAESGAGPTASAS